MSTQRDAGQPAVVLTVDDHPLIRSALREVLTATADGIELIEASDPDQGLAALHRRPDIDLAFLDLRFPHHDGLAFLERFRAAAPAVPVIVYTMHEDAPTLQRALALGAAGIVPKTHSRELLQRAVRTVMEGGVYMPPEFAGPQGEGAKAGPEAAIRLDAPPRHGMSQQQWRILELLAQGLPNKEIARRLGIASSTVKNQLTVVFERLGVSNRTQAAIAARALLTSRRAE